MCTQANPDPVRGPWIRTATGKQFHLLDPHPDEICIEDVATTLANQARYYGARGNRCTVAVHSMAVAAWLRGMGYTPSVQLQGLMHDVTETWMGDVAGPWKLLPIFDEYRRLESQVFQVASEKLKFDYPFDPIIKVADDQCFLMEEVYYGDQCIEFDDSARRGRDYAFSAYRFSDTADSFNVERVFIYRYHKLLQECQQYEGAK